MLGSLLLNRLSDWSLTSQHRVKKSAAYYLLCVKTLKLCHMCSVRHIHFTCQPCWLWKWELCIWRCLIHHQLPKTAVASVTNRRKIHLCPLTDEEKSSCDCILFLHTEDASMRWSKKSLLFFAPFVPSWADGWIILGVCVSEDRKTDW